MTHEHIIRLGKFDQDLHNPKLAKWHVNPKLAPSCKWSSKFYQECCSLGHHHGSL
jgi:hypothetical protein